MVQNPFISDDGPNMDERMGWKHVEPPPSDSRFDKWLRWLKSIDDEVTALHGNRAVWQGINEIIASHPNMPPSHFFRHYANIYVTTQVTAVRRQTECKDNVITLARLMSEIYDHPQSVTRERYVSLYPAGSQWLGDQDFDKYAGLKNAHIDPSVVAADQQKLSDSAARCGRTSTSSLLTTTQNRSPSNRFQHSPNSIQ